MINSDVIPALNESTGRLLRELGRFSSRDFNTATGSTWNAGQIAEHILLTDIAVSRVLQGELGFAGRKTDEKLPLMKAQLTNRSQKIDSPTASAPSDALKDPITLQKNITRERNSIVQFLSSVEEDALCLARPNRIFGELTITEWVWFIIYHTDRHIEQLKELEIVNS